MTAPSPAPADPDPAPGAPSSAQWLSALADGDKEALPHAQALWRDDAEARERWHLYHLIGDVMRSEDLASSPGRDVALIAAVRSRLAVEPVPLAPAPLAPAPLTPQGAQAASAASRRLGWRAPAAVAAGFVAVAAALVLVRPAEFTPTEPRQLAKDGRVIRDPQLDAYLAAHRLFEGGAAAALPGGLMRPVELTTTVPLAPGAGVTPVPASRPGAASQPASPAR